MTGPPVITYAWPPLAATDSVTVSAAIAAELDRAWQRVEVQRERVLRSTEEGAKARALARLAEFQAAVEDYQRQVETLAAEYVRVVVGEYAAGAAAGAAAVGISNTWTMADRNALASLASDSYGDLLRRSQDAGQTAERFARAVRSTAGEFIPGGASGQTLQQAGRDWRKALEERYRVSSVVYADGSMRSIRDYTDMAVRTKGRVAYNAGALARFADAGVEYVEVYDGPDCGWTQHDDPDRAHGSIRSAAEAAEYAIAHPRCRRSFGPRPDVTTERERREARAFSDDVEPAELMPEPARTSAAAQRAESRWAAAAARRASRQAG